MTDLCRNCAKLMCEYRDNPERQECNDKVTFLQAGILDRPKVVEPKRHRFSRKEN